MAPKLTDGSFRIKIDGYWTALELAHLMRSLEDIYNLSAILSSRNFGRHEFATRMFPIDRRVIRRLALDDVKIPALMVPQFKYASPGFADLLGAGESLKQLKEFILEVTDRFLGAEQRRLDNEARRLANEKAAAELQRYKEDTPAASSHKSHTRALSIQERQLKNELLAEEAHAARIVNITSETNMFSKSMSKVMKQKRLTGEQQAQIVHWIGTRAQPLAELADEGKLDGVEDVPPNDE
jgi:hypothetical protein